MSYFLKTLAIYAKKVRNTVILYQTSYRIVKYPYKISHISDERQDPQVDPFTKSRLRCLKSVYLSICFHIILLQYMVEPNRLALDTCGSGHVKN